MVGWLAGWLAGWRGRAVKIDRKLDTVVGNGDAGRSVGQAAIVRGGGGGRNYLRANWPLFVAQKKRLA